jgi:hypothetical protein
MTRGRSLRKRPKARLTLTPLHCTAAALALLLLAGCAGESSIPFLPSATPPSPGPPPELPLLVPPPRDREIAKPVLTPDEQKELEAQLLKLEATREKAVRRGIEKGN